MALQLHFMSLIVKNLTSLLVVIELPSFTAEHVKEESKVGARQGGGQLSMTRVCDA